MEPERMMKVIPTWVFLAVPLALLYVIGIIIDHVKDYRERKMLHYIIDGDRIENQRSRRNQKCAMNHERRYL